MRELSLFSGAGGGLLGTGLIGWKPVGYVEVDYYCQRVLRQRIMDGFLPEAPIYGDIRAFNSDGYAESYQGLVDVVTAGFPCQPFSVAGKKRGADDERNMWPSTAECLRLVRPRYALLENVPGLLAHEYFGDILAELAESGFDVRWRLLSAAELGAPHVRKRLWIVADAGCRGCGAAWCRLCESEPPGKRRRRSADRRDEVDVPDADGRRRRQLHTAAESDHTRQPARPSAQKRRETWWSTEPPLGRVAHGVADRVGQLKALGNGQVPAVAATVWKLLAGGL